MAMLVQGIRHRWITVPVVLCFFALRAGAGPVEEISEHTDKRTGRVVFLRNEAAQDTAAKVARRAKPALPATPPAFNRDELSAPQWTNAVAAANGFLARHAAVLGEKEPARNLALNRAERDQLGMTHVRYDQTHQGLPVFGAGVIVHLAPDGQVSSAGGSLVPDLRVATTSGLDRERAIALAVGLWQSQFHRTNAPEVRSAGLCILAPGMLRNNGDPSAYLVWEIKLALDSKPPGVPISREDYYIDAQTGELREQLTGTHHIYRQIGDCSVEPGTDTVGWNTTNSVLGYVFGREEGDPPRGPNPRYLPGEQSTDTDTLYDMLASCHNFYWDTFGRDGGNGQGGMGDGSISPVWDTVGYTYLDFLSYWQGICPNAMFSEGTVSFCKDTVVPDIVGHEYSHSIAYFSHYDGSVPVGMVYQDESGALNENFADLFGEGIELYITQSTDWMLVESKSGSLSRDLRNPPSLLGYDNVRFPDRFTCGSVYCDWADYGGVHQNSTIPSKAAYLASEGGSFNGCSIQGIGLGKVEQVWYRAMTQYYTRRENFNGAYYKLIQSAADLYGSNSAEVRQVRRALQSVEMDQPSYCYYPAARVPQALDTEGW